MKKNNRTNKNWSFQEIKYLKNNWGEKSIKAIAKTLERTPSAIQIKANRIGLKRLTDYGEYITFYQFLKIINKTSYHKYDKKLIKSGFPLKQMLIISKRMKIVYMCDFWKWLGKNNNKHLIDLAHTTKGDLGPEPEWVDIKRQADKRAAAYTFLRKWTDNEDKRLINLLNTYNYGYREISIRLKRTEGAIKRRMIDLNIKSRPLKADNHNLWQADEINTVKDLYKKGFKSCIIAEYVNRSASAINGLLERNNYFLTKKGK